MTIEDDEIQAKIDRALGKAVPGRTPLKQSMRADSVRDPMRKERRFKGGEEDKFLIDPNDVPPDESWEWKRELVFGKEDYSYMMRLQGNCWEPVDASRVPHMMPLGYQGPVRREGTILMCRPKYLTEEARLEEHAKAAQNIRIKEQQASLTPQGTLERLPATIRRTSGSSEITVPE